MRRYVITASKIAVSVILLALLFGRVDVGRLWASARNASLAWLAVAFAIYCLNVLASIWRWRLLLGAQAVYVRRRTLLGSFLVALFFNNFLPSNIGGDVVRIKDTARPAGSKTLATTVILVDRVIGLMGLVLVAAIGATMASRASGVGATPVMPGWLWAGFFAGAAMSAPALLAPAGFGRLLQPLTVFHPEWVGSRIERLTAVLARFRGQPSAIGSCFVGAVFVQGLVVVYFVAVAHALRINITLWELAVIVPLSFVVQLIPVSVNGFGVREATFTFYFHQVGLPPESGLLLSLVATALAMVFSLVGAGVYVARQH